MVSFSAAAVILILVSMNVGSVKQRRNVDRVDAVGVPPAQPAAPRLAGKAQIGADQPAIAGNLVMKESVALAQPRTASVIRTATLRIVAKDFNAVRPAVESIASSFTGFLDHMTVTGDTASARQLRAILRVPGDRMTGALARLRQLGAVVEDTQGAQDVTDQMVDLDARLANARSTEQRLTEILKNRTGKLSDVLEVEREVSRVRLEIERIDAEKANLDRRVTYATIDISITEERKASIDGPLSLTTRLRLAALDGLEGALDSAAAAMLFVLRTAPTLLLWGTVIGAGLLGWRRISRLKPGTT